MLPDIRVSQDTLSLEHPLVLVNLMDPGVASNQDVRMSEVVIML